MIEFEKKLIKYTILIIVTALLGMWLCFEVMFRICPQQVPPTIDESVQAQIELTTKMNIVKMEIINEMDNYIFEVAPNCEINSKVFFELCDKYEIDVRFAMAQGHIESHYATKGTAAKTKSIFNVGAFDGYSAVKQIQKGFGYNDPNDSIEPYLALLNKDYLVNGKTIDDLLVNFVNKSNKRYASNPKYERMLRNTFNNINNNTQLDILIAEYLEYKEQLG